MSQTQFYLTHYSTFFDYTRKEEIEEGGKKNKEEWNEKEGEELKGSTERFEHEKDSLQQARDSN